MNRRRYLHSAGLWLGAGALIVVYELFTLADGKDSREPMTHHVSKIVGRRPWLGSLLFGFLAWLAFHFTHESTRERLNELEARLEDSGG